MVRAGTLTPTAIASAALRVGDRAGPAAMTMRRIAAELGCDPMALYRHFADRTALLDAVADAALGAVPDPPAEADWEDRLRSVCTGIRAAALSHPGIAAHIAARPPLGPHGRRLAAAMFDALTAAGLSPPTVVRAVQTLVAHIAAGLAMAVRAGVKDGRWVAVSETIAGLPGGPPGSDLPVTGSDEQFAFGLRLLLAGIRAEAG